MTYAQMVYIMHIFFLHIPYGIKGSPVSPPCQVPQMIRVLGFKDCTLNTERPKVSLPTGVNLRLNGFLKHYILFALNNGSVLCLTINCY